MSTESVLADGVREALAVDPEEFDARAEEEAEIVKQGPATAPSTTSRSWASSTSSTRSPTGGGARSHERASTPPDAGPRRLLELMGFEKELGLHNAEMSTSPQPLSDHGLRAQLAEVRATGGRGEHRWRRGNAARLDAPLDHPADW